MTARYFGPCRAGLHPEFGWGDPCMNDASEYVGVDSPVAGLRIGDTFQPAETLMKLCTDHADAAEQMDGYRRRSLLVIPYEPPAVTS